MTRARSFSARSRRAARLLVAVSSLAGIILPLSLVAQDNVPKQTFDVPSGDARPALRQFASQARREIVFEVSEVAGITTRTVKGQMTAGEALDTMLTGTGLIARRDSKTGAFAVRKETASEKNAGRTNAKTRDRPSAVNSRGQSDVSDVTVQQFPMGTVNAVSTGALIGRVSNITDGNYVNSARVTIKGTTLEALTNESGEFRFHNVPAGTIAVSISFAGSVSQTETAMILAGAVTTLDFIINMGTSGTADSESRPLMLEKFTVRAKEMTTQAIALQERRSAPNIKNVVAIEDDIGEGNVGEFLKAIPGIAMDQNPGAPQFAYIRGMPTSGTVISMDGTQIASTGFTGRSVDLGLAAAGSIDRIEVSKVPTPDMPANAIGGSINMVSKSAFSRRTPLFTYNVFATASLRDGYRNGGQGELFGKSLGPDGKSNMDRINPSFMTETSTP